ncbi:MAG: serine/threonine protein kinase [Planctomycetales bacterium]|nr:serine/threonine protein kinase [Planctomycetales bacterium]
MSSIQEIEQRLIESQLLSTDEVHAELLAWRAASSAAADESGDAASFVDWLIQRERVTEFQGDAIEAGHVGPFMLGPYRVFEQIAPGRLGGMFRATHVEFDQPVTLKVFPSSLRDDPEKLARMGREVRIFSELDHPNVVRSFQVGQAGEITYIALEELRGETLASRLERQGRLPYAEACRLVRDVARGLEHLHQNEVLHRDLQPAHIWISEQGVAKVMEFGAARDAYSALDVPEGSAELTLTDAFSGNYAYMAPEQAEDMRLADARSDLYSLGCVLYHCLAGQPPFFDPNPIRLVLKHARHEAPKVHESVAEVPAPLDETLAGLLAKRAGERFQTAGDVVYALEQYVPAAEEHVGVVEVSSQYLDWVRATTPTETRHVHETSEGISPQLTEFLGWMSRRKKRRQA